MTVSKESLLKSERRHEHRTKVGGAMLYDDDAAIYQSATSNSEQCNETMVNPMHLQQRRHNEAIHSPSEIQLSGTMKANHADSTLVIYSSRGRATELYTEIPFAAIHGMQTIQRDECELLADVEEIRSGSVTVPLLVATFANSISQFLVGYNIAVLNTPEKFVFPGHSTLSWSWAVSALAIGAPFGAIIGSSLSDTYGRRPALIVNSMGFLIGGAVQTLAPSLEILTLARFVLGLMSGIATVLVPIYLGELAPPHLRGMLGTINQFAFVVGILVADLLSFGFATEDGWRFLFAMTSFVAFLQILTIPFVVESPRFLLHCNPRDKEAKEILKILRGYTSHEDINKEVETYIRANTPKCTPTPRMLSPWTDIENKQSFPSKMHSDDDEKDENIFWEIVSIPDIRFFFFCSICLHVGQQLCGVNAVFYYSTLLFEDIISNPLLGTTSIGAINVLFTYVALLLMDSCRRKSLLLWSIGGMMISCIGLILCQCEILQGKGILTLVLTNAYVAFFAIGVGPIPFLWIAEMFEPRYVALTMSICSQLNWVVNFVVGLVFPLMNEYLGGLTFVPFAAVLFVSFFFVWKVLPEHRNSAISNGHNVTVKNDSQKIDTAKR